MLQPTKHWSMETAIEQLKKCDYECQGGPLEMNDAFIWLDASHKIGPKFWPGQGVWYEIVAKAAGKELKQWVHFFIVGCTMSSDTESRTWLYDLSYDPPAPWHYGETHFKQVHERGLRLEKPTH